MAGRRSSVAIVARIAAVVLGVVTAVVAVGCAGALLQEWPGPAAQLGAGSHPPWLGSADRRDPSAELRQAAELSPPGNLTSTTNLTFTGGDEHHDSEVRVAASVSGPVDDPFLRAVRAGSGTGDVLAGLAGLDPLIASSYLVWGDPHVTVHLGRMSARVDAVGQVAHTARTTVGFGVRDLCRQVAQRTVTVTAVRATVTSVTTDPTGSTGSGCPASGGWQEQTPTRATLQGTVAASAVLTSDAEAPGSRAAIERRPLLAGGDTVARFAFSLRYTVLLALPLLLCWLRLRPAVAGTSLRRWSAASVVGRRTSTALGLVLLLHLLIAAGGVLGIAESGLAGVWHGSSLDRIPPPPNGLQPAFLIVALAYVWRRVAARRSPGDDRRRATGDVVRLLAAGALVVAAATAAWGSTDGVTWLGGVFDDQAWPIWPGRLLILAGALVVAVLASAAAGWAAGVTGADRWTLAAAPVLVTGLLAVYPLTYYAGVVPVVTASLVPLAAGTAIWLGLDRMVRSAVNASPPTRWATWRPVLRRWRGLRFVAALLLSLPVVVYGADEGARIGWYDFVSLGSSIDNALRLIALFLVVLVLRHLGLRGAGDRARGSYAQLRAVVVLTAVAGLLSPTVVAAGLPVAFLLGWLLVEVWLLPRPAGGNTRPPVGPAARRQAGEALDKVTGDVVEQRLTSSLESELRKKLADDNPDETTQKARVTAARALVMKPPATSVAEWRRALSGYGGVEPWRRARELALIGLVVGTPWTLFDIAAVLRTISSGGPFRFTDAAAGVLVILRFAVAGLVLGAGYPMIRGGTGLTKGLNLFVVLAGPALAVTLLPDPRAENAATGALLQLTQWLSFALVIGLVADYLTFRRRGLAFRHLRELHRMNALTASVSTLLVAVVTATATAVGTGAAGVFVENVLTPAPPAAVSDPAGEQADRGSPSPR